MNMMMCTDCGNINNKAHVSTNEGKINKIHKKLSSEEDISHFIPHLEKLLLRHIHNTWHLGTSNKKLTPHTFNFFNKNQRIKVKEREKELQSPTRPQQPQTSNFSAYVLLLHCCSTTTTIIYTTHQH
jgi:hypothetical protein